MISLSVLEASLRELKRKIESFENAIPLIQVDIGDGLFVEFKPEFTPQQAVELFPQLTFQIHLMVLNPTDFVSTKYPNFQSVIFHAETEENYLKTAEFYKRLGYEVGLCINLETPAPEYFENIDFIQFMSVVPGAQHNKFDPSVIQKIYTFHKNFPDIRVQVDGGINDTNIYELKKAGATDFTVGSYIITASNQIEAYTKLCGI